MIPILLSLFQVNSRRTWDNLKAHPPFSPCSLTLPHRRDHMHFLSRLKKQISFGFCARSEIRASTDTIRPLSRMGTKTGLSIHRKTGIDLRAKRFNHPIACRLDVGRATSLSTVRQDSVISCLRSSSETHGRHKDINANRTAPKWTGLTGECYGD
jgi:hypothetical protein